MSGKCDKHGTDYKKQYFPDGKSREYCKECEREQLSPFTGRFGRRGSSF